MDKTGSEIEAYEESTGHYYVSSKNLDSYEFPFNPRLTINFSKLNYFRTFDFFQKFKHPINALIIADDYLFTKDNSFDNKSAELNLKPILRRLLPKKLEKKFYLTIICCPKGHNIQENDLRNEIASIFEPYNYEYKFELIISSFHKRILLTNYAYLESDRGFRNITYDQRKERNVSCQTKNDFDFSYIFESDKIVKKYMARISELKELCGNSENRLLK